MENKDLQEAWDYLDDCLDDCKIIIENGVPAADDEDRIEEFNREFWLLKEAIKTVEKEWNKANGK